MKKPLPFSSNFDPDKRSYVGLPLPTSEDFKNELTRIMGRLSPETLDSEEGAFYLKLAERFARDANVTAYIIYRYHAGTSFPKEEKVWVVYNALKLIQPVD